MSGSNDKRRNNMDGIFSITFRGATDWGQGILLFQNGIIVGADTGAVLYDGTYKEDEFTVHVQMTMTVPAGGQLVQGTPILPHAYKIDFKTILTKKDVFESNPILIDLPPGPVNIIFKLLRQL